MNDIMGDTSNLSNQIPSGAKFTYSCASARRRGGISDIIDETEIGFRRPVTKRRTNQISDCSSKSSLEDISYLKRSSSEEEESYEMNHVGGDISFNSCGKKKHEEEINIPSGAEDAYSCVKRKMNEIMSESNSSLNSGTEAAFRCPALKKKMNEIIEESTGILSLESEAFSSGKRKINDVEDKSGIDTSDMEIAYRYATAKRKNIEGESSCNISSVVNNVKNNNNSSKNNNPPIGPNGEGISAAVAKVLKGYDWNLVPVATK